jgi:hypothetical protein
MLPVRTNETNDQLFPTRTGKVEPLPIHREPHCVTSHWQLTNEDVEALRANGGIISFTIVAAAHPPIMLAADPAIRRVKEPAAKNGTNP